MTVRECAICHNAWVEIDTEKHGGPVVEPICAKCREKAKDETIRP